MSVILYHGIEAMFSNTSSECKALNCERRCGRQKRVREKQNIYIFQPDDYFRLIPN